VTRGRTPTWDRADGPAGGKPSALSGVSREGRVALGTADNQVVFLTLCGLAPDQASRHSSGVI
jgi:hypothetical protein